MTIFNNGKFQKCSNGELKEFMPGMVEGKGVFETMAVYDGKIFAWQPHWVRFQKGLRLMSIVFPYSQKVIENRMIEILQKNKLKNARIRLMVSQKDKKQSIHIVAMSTTKPSTQKYSQGFHLMVSSYLRNKGRYTHIKSIDYKKLNKAHKDARSQGYDDALLFNGNGYCVEASYANIFFVSKGMLLFPPVSSGCLNGVTRNIIQIMADDLNIPFKIKNIKRAQLFKVDEVFITNSVLEIMPVTSIDGQKIGTGRPGDITKNLADAYIKLIDAFKKQKG